MRRVFLAAVLALVFHSLLFTIRFEGPKATLVQPPRPLTLSLVQGPAEPLASLAGSRLQEPQDPPRFNRPQPKEDKTQRQETSNPKKSPNKMDSSLPPPQEQVSPSTGSPGLPAEEVPGTATPQEFPSPTQASTAIPVHEAAPLYRQNPVPDYPLLGRKRGYQGTVIIDVLVSREGRVSALRLSSSSGYTVLDQAALTSVKTWLFHPGTRGEEKVDMWVKVPVRFQLE